MASDVAVRNKHFIRKRSSVRRCLNKPDAFQACGRIRTRRSGEYGSGDIEQRGSRNGKTKSEKKRDDESTQGKLRMIVNRH